ncbi:MAG TPA: dihydroorotate dehydrogenase electron transfer subunit [Alphaproteobacteria bacterium]|nr:dihydroorotate dehydrogenase electron transfer subunit [Alphaproteobacteria bacterium]
MQVVDKEPASGTSLERYPVAETICPVLKNEPVNDGYYHLVLDAAHGAAMAKAGQFFHLLCPATGDFTPFLRRPMSIYRIDRAQGRLEFLYKMVGAGTKALATLKPGDGLDIFGPLGQGFKLDEGWKHVLMVARGVGLATLAPLAEMAAERGVRVTAILSARSPEYMMSEDYLRSVGAEVVTVTDADGTSSVEDVERIVRTIVETEGVDLFATCGSNRLLTMLQRLAREYGIPGQVALEQLMGCGIGMCFVCVLPFRTPDGLEYKRVCKDGPVFPIEEALSW